MMASGNTDFVEVVTAAPFADADESFRVWLQEAGIRRSDLADDDLRIDTVRGLNGLSLRRYMVRRRAIPAEES